VLRNNATIDWNLCESARAKMRVMVKRLLKKHGYPPDKTEHGTALVLAQAEVVCEEWHDLAAAARRRMSRTGARGTARV
jgi:type I restriction enzyme, R subunit